MKKIVVLLICSQIINISVSVQINTGVISGISYYKLFYSLVNRELKNSENVEEHKEIERGVLVEKINELEMCFENGYPTYGCNLSYYRIPTLQNLHNVNYKDSDLTITDQYKLLSFSGEYFFIGFHLNNFRYGLNLNSNKVLNVPDFELGTTWQARLLDNEWVYTADDSSRRMFDENFWVEYKVVQVQSIDPEVKRFTIDWKGLRSYPGAVWHWDWYSKRHGRLVIDSDGVLQEFTINSPKLMSMFEYYAFTDDKKRENCLKIIKIGQEEFNNLKPKIRS